MPAACAVTPLELRKESRSHGLTDRSSTVRARNLPLGDFVQDLSKDLSTDRSKSQKIRAVKIGMQIVRLAFPPGNMSYAVDHECLVQVRDKNVSVLKDLYS